MAPAPVFAAALVLRDDAQPENFTEVPGTRASLPLEGDILEAWGQGYNVGSLIILILILLCNYRKRILLHKLILLELFLALWHGTFIFFNDPTYGWYLSSTAALLFISYQLHNLVSWLKIKPFLPTWGARTFIITLILVQPFWIVDMWANFQYFNDLGSDLFSSIRPWEAVARDPWWIFTTCQLVWIIKRDYNYTFLSLIRTSPRFGIMLLCMFLSIVFLLTDIVITVGKISIASGINPYWRLALVFKCASDTIFLDDFKSVLDGIVKDSLRRAQNPYSSTNGQSGRHDKSSNGMQRRVKTGPVVTISSENKPLNADHSWRDKMPWKPSRPDHVDIVVDKDSKRDSDSSSDQIKMRIQATTTTTMATEQQRGPTPESPPTRFGSQDDILPIQHAAPFPDAPPERWDSRSADGRGRGSIPLRPVAARVPSRSRDRMH